MFNAGNTAPTRVLIASAETNTRSLLMNLANALHGFKIVGSIRSQDRALDRVLLSAPDVLLIHADMLVKEKEMLSQLRQYLPQLKTVVCGVDLSQDVMKKFVSEGATDALSFSPHMDQEKDSASGQQLIARLNAVLHGRQKPTYAAPVAPPVKVPAVVPQTNRKTLAPSALVIGCSTGGPVALANILQLLPRDFPLPVAVVQHMPPLFTTMLAERLDKICSLDVSEAVHGQSFVPGRILIAPGDFHMRLRKNGKEYRVELDQEEREHSCRPAVNVLFRSAAEVFGGNVLTVVLTGMGKDGLQGVEQLHSLGSRIVVQDAATSTVWGMPGAIVQAGFADAILPLGEIIPDLLRYV